MTLARVLFVVTAVAAVYVLHGDYGITWDEPVHSIYGDLVRAYFASGGSDHRSEEFLDLRYYGPFADLLPSLIHPANDLAKYDIRHVLCGLFAVLALIATWAFARLTPGRLVAPFALLALATMPRFVGHAFDNLKDVPFACALALFVTAVASMSVARDFRRPRVIHCGLAAGFVLCVRPGGFPLVVALLLAFSFLSEVTVGQGVPVPGRSLLLRLSTVLSIAWALTVRLCTVLSIAWVLMVIPWPYAHRDPLWHPIEAMAVARSFPYSPEVLFDGVAIRSVDLPRTYPVRMLLITTPPSLLLLALLGLGRMARAQIAEPRSSAACLYAMTEIWLLVPLVGMAIAHPNVYDGIRHVLFVLPALAIMAAVGAASLVDVLPARRGLATASVLLVLIAPTAELVRLHPYQTTYFNALVGGLPGAEGRFDTDYWVSSYKEAFEWVNDRARRDPARTLHVLIAGTPYLEPLGELYRAPNVKTRVVETIGPERTLPPGVDYCIATSRWGYAKRLFPEAPMVHSIGRDGAVFTVIRGRSDGAR